MTICKSWSFNSSLSSTNSILQAQVCSYVYHVIVLTNSTGYCMCTHIAKSLQTQCKAIQNAVQYYNTAATAMSPPHPTLDWSMASHYTFLEDFELLYNTHHNICTKHWADPVIQSTMKQASCIKHAKEEVEMCNFKIQYLFTHIL